MRTHRREVTPAALAELLERYPDTFMVERMDVADHAMIDAVAARYRDEPIDVLINNAGIVGALDYVDEQQFGQLDFDLLALFFRINVAGRSRSARRSCRAWVAGRGKRRIAISSSAGSFEAAAVNRPGRIHYKTSKAALNMAVTGIAAATRERGIIAVSLHPGGVKVEKLAGLDLPGFIEPKVSIAGMIAVIDALGTGGFGLVPRLPGQADALVAGQQLVLFLFFFSFLFFTTTITGSVTYCYSNPEITGKKTRDTYCRPELVLYVEDPLLGAQFNGTVSTEQEFSSSEIT